jgi:hypothetical protein
VIDAHRRVYRTLVELGRGVRMNVARHAYGMRVIERALNPVLSRRKRHAQQ